MVKRLLVLTLFAVNAWGQSYPGNTLHDFDITRPPDTGEPAKYGASAIREIKRCVNGTISNSLDLTTGLLLSNSIPAYAFKSNSIPLSALATNTTSGRSQMLGFTSTGGYVPITAIMPFTSTVPTNTQGTQLLTLTVTPTFSNSTFVVRAQVTASAVGGDKSAVAAIFTNSSLAVAASGGGNSGASGNPFSIPVVCRLVQSAPNGGAATFQLRAGPTQNATTLNVNGDNSAQTLGGTASTYLEVDEIFP